VHEVDFDGGGEEAHVSFSTSGSVSPLGTRQRACVTVRCTRFPNWTPPTALEARGAPSFVHSNLMAWEAPGFFGHKSVILARSQLRCIRAGGL
jgi:hypothetical protein